jgi:hypothetical protein
MRKVHYLFSLKINLQIFHHKRQLWSICYGKNTVAAVVAVVVVVVVAVGVVAAISQIY